MNALWVNEVKNVALAANQLAGLILGLGTVQQFLLCALVRHASSNQRGQLN